MVLRRKYATNPAAIISLHAIRQYVVVTVKLEAGAYRLLLLLVVHEHHLRRAQIR